jgi:integrase
MKQHEALKTLKFCYFDEHLSDRKAVALWRQYRDRVAALEPRNIAALPVLSLTEAEQQAVAETAGLPAGKRHPHVLKHSLASHLIAGNVNLALVKQALGHRSIGSTMVYVGTTDAQAAEAVQAALMGVF